MMTLLSESLKGLKRIRNAMLVSGLIYPLVALILIWPLTSLFGASGASLAYVIGTSAAALLGIVFWRGELGKKDAVTEKFDSVTLWKSCRPLWLMSFVNRAVLPWLPLFLLGIWGTAQDAGIFGAAMRISVLVSFFLMAANTALVPKFGELYATGNIQALGGLARKVTAFITIATSPLLFLLIFAGDWVMSMFGQDFTRGGAVLAILAVGQAVNTMTGSVGYILMISGNEKDVRNSSLIAVVTLAIASIMLIPIYGIVGAAIASSLSVIAMNIANSILVWVRCDLIIIPFIGVKVA